MALPNPLFNLTGYQKNFYSCKTPYDDDPFSNDETNCDCFLKAYMTSKFSEVNMKHLVYSLLVLISIAGLIMVVYVTFKSKQHNQHPSQLIALICIVEIMLVWSSYIQSPDIDAGYAVCYLNLYKITPSLYPWLF